MAEDTYIVFYLSLISHDDLEKNKKRSMIRDSLQINY
jgi:hypothetical protein